MKSLLSLVNAMILSLALVLLGGCGANTPPMVKLGLLAPFEELYRNDGYAALHAVKLAISQRNASGGAGGRQVALVALNDNGRPGEARQQAINLGVDRDVLGVIGPLHSDTVTAAGPVLAGEQLPWVALASVAPGQLPGGFALEASSSHLARSAEQLLAVGSVLDPSATLTDPSAAPDGLAGAIWLGDVAGGAMVANSLKPGAVLVGGPELGSSVFPGLAGDAIDPADGIAVTWLSAGPDTAALPAEFVAAYRELAGVAPSPQAVLAYDATNLLLDAIERASRQDAVLTRESVHRAAVELGVAGWNGLSGLVVWQNDACPAAQLCWPRLDPPVSGHRW
jgi:ABC-type branched-subunit amino acid transport system substrate-binding protein